MNKLLTRNSLNPSHKFLVICFFTSLFNIQHSSASPVSDLISKPFLSSIPGIFVESRNFNPVERSLTLHPERNIISPIPLRNALNYTFALQSNSQAPVLFVIPGIGGTASNGPTLFLAQKAFEQGYSVITVSSSTHWSFAVAASSTGRMGYLPDDAADLYRVLATIKTKLESEKGIRPSKWGLLGYSYGGLDGAFLMNQDSKSKTFNFDFLVLINPPLKRQIAVSKTDDYFATGNKWSDDRKKSFASFITGRFVEIAKHERSIESVSDLQEAFPLKENQLAWIMSNEFRRVVLNSAYVGMVLANKAPVSPDESFSGNLGDYLRESVFQEKARTSKIPLNDLLTQSELSFALKGISRSKKVVLFHSTNDYLSFPHGNVSVDAPNVQNLHIYPYGGHLGALSDSVFMNDLTKTLGSLK